MKIIITEVHHSEQCSKKRILSNNLDVMTILK